MADDTVVNREFQMARNDQVFVIDDFQSEPSPNVSSSGGTVAYDVQNLWEGVMCDADGTFAWDPSDPMNGMSRAGTDDSAKALAFDWSVESDRFLEFEVVPDGRDFSRYVYLSLRACQGTRHPETVAELADLTFTVTLRDGDGVSSSINIRAYGAGIQEPYQRTGAGAGAGWQNEFETVRLHLTGFLHNGSDLDLTNIEAVRFEFGVSFGSCRGRLFIDDVCVSDLRPAPCSLGKACVGGVCTSACTDDADCDDGDFCNGLEWCIDGKCREGAAPCGPDEVCIEEDRKCTSKEDFVAARPAPGALCGSLGTEWGSAGMIAFPLLSGMMGFRFRKWQCATSWRRD